MVIRISFPPIKIAVMTFKIILSQTTPIRLIRTHISPTNMIVLAIVGANVIKGIFDATIYNTTNAKPIPNFGQNVNSQGNA